MTAPAIPSAATAARRNRWAVSFADLLMLLLGFFVLLQATGSQRRDLLRFLMQNARTVVSKSQILDRVWHYDFAGRSNIVEQYVGYLRRKVDADREPLIHTVRGVGYVLRAPRPGDISE